MSKETIKNCTKPKKIFHWAQRPKLHHEAFLSSIRNLEWFGRKEPNRADLYETSRIHHKTYKVWSVSHQTILCFVWNLERLRSEVFAAVPSGRFFSRFRRIVYCLFRHFNSFESIQTSTEHFLVVQEKTYFFRVLYMRHMQGLYCD